MAGWTTALTRFFVRQDEEPDAGVDEDVRRALARIERYPGNRPADRHERRKPVAQPANNVISLWPR
jgi:hypothetical protein